MPAEKVFWVGFLGPNTSKLMGVWKPRVMIFLFMSTGDVPSLKIGNRPQNGDESFEPTIPFAGVSTRD